MYLKIQYRFAVYRVALALGFGGALGRPGAWVFHLPSGPCVQAQGWSEAKRGPQRSEDHSAQAPQAPGG